MSGIRICNINISPFDGSGSFDAISDGNNKLIRFDYDTKKKEEKEFLKNIPVKDYPYWLVIKTDEKFAFNKNFLQHVGGIGTWFFVHWFLDTETFQLANGNQCVLRDTKSINYILDSYWNYIDTSKDIQPSNIANIERDVSIISWIIVFLCYAVFFGLSLKLFISKIPLSNKIFLMLKNLDLKMLKKNLKHVAPNKTTILSSLLLYFMKKYSLGLSPTKIIMFHRKVSFWVSRLKIKSNKTFRKLKTQAYVSWITYKQNEHGKNYHNQENINKSPVKFTEIKKILINRL